MDAVPQAALLTAFPVGAAALGASVAAFRQPRPATMSAVQHFAAGVVIAAVVGEVLPDLRDRQHWGWAVVGFGVGVVLMLTLGAFGRLLDRRQPSGTLAVAARAAVPIGLLAAVAVDLLVDGVLVGLGSTLGSAQAVILTAALTIEILFLALSVQGELVEAGLTRFRAAGLSGGLGLMTAVGAVGSAAALGNAGEGLVAAALAFGAAALLYLAVEELLVEAHEENETVLLSAMFFVGFLVIYGLAQVGG